MTKRGKRYLWNLLRGLAIIYIGLTLCCSCEQEKLIFPGQTRSHAAIHPPEDCTLVPLTTSNGDHIVTLLCKSSQPNAPTLIFFYGNGNVLGDFVQSCRNWRNMGANVLAVEYPGYGMSDGKPTEKSLYAAADAAYDYVASHDDFDKTKIVPFGISLGTGVAVDLASRKPVAGLILLAPYTSMDEMARRVMPWLPTGLILRHHFRNIDKMPLLHIPILMIHGRHDSLIPVEMSARLETAAKNAQVTRIVVNSDHNDILDQSEIDPALAKFIEQISR